MKTKNKSILKILNLCFVALLFFSLQRFGISVFLNRQKAYVNVDNKIYEVIPYKSIPLKDILAKNNIILNEGDIVSCDIQKPIKPLPTVRVARLTKEQKQTKTTTPFRIIWKRQYNSNLRDIELQKGVQKDIKKTVHQIFYDGIFHKEEVLDEKISSKEYYQVVLFSSSSNNVEKVYDLSKAKRIEVIATAYYPGDPLAWGDGTVTVLGQKMQRGIVAVDPKVIPLKTRLFISGYGYGYAGDTGNFIKGKRIDLGVNNEKEEKAWMFRKTTVYILESSTTY
ncbi:MAG: 3D domain-containing protein [Endomicrobium sp.]|jgi:3D (Asp-Asp-Asp) domain-containing protein|nr:3D domain-containing protein [Endomicrobium sp.]